MGALAICLNMSFLYIFGQNHLPVTQCISVFHILIPVYGLIIFVFFFTKIAISWKLFNIFPKNKNLSILDLDNKFRDEEIVIFGDGIYI